MVRTLCGKLNVTIVLVCYTMWITKYNHDAVHYVVITKCNTIAGALHTAASYGAGATHHVHNRMQP